MCYITSGDIAVDWIAGNIYWVDSSWARIEAMNLASLNRTEILRTGANTNPSAIAVDPLMRSTMSFCIYLHILFHLLQIHVLE